MISIPADFIYDSDWINRIFCIYCYSELMFIQLGNENEGFIFARMFCFQIRGDIISYMTLRIYILWPLQV